MHRRDALNVWLVFSSSIIFVILIAIWVSYLVLHTVRRREHLATARSVDRFSTEMRILQRRAVKSSPHAASRRVSTAGLTRAQILTSDDASSPEPLDGVSDEIADSLPLGAASSPLAPASSPIAPASSPVAPASSPVAPASSPVRVRRTFTAIGAVGAQAERLGRLTGPRVRLAALAASVLVLGAAVVVSLLGMVASWSIGVGVAAVVVALAWIRSAARSTTAKRRRRVQADRSARHVAHDASVRAARQARPAAPAFPAAQEHVDYVENPVSRSVHVPEPEVLVAAEPEPYDALADVPGWSPTPVPPPTYTLKARAEHPLPPAREVPVPLDVDDVYDAWDAWERATTSAASATSTTQRAVGS